MVRSIVSGAPARAFDCPNEKNINRQANAIPKYVISRNPFARRTFDERIRGRREAEIIGGASKYWTPHRTNRYVSAHV